ncbi:hypothetical protein EVAR_55840_1 [Eumeta japonica]|uniref:Uncharacterized protein n=1 Tax=Eumeta variegata TaxID=151549 RepID=A0A4C1YY45_EUMVA|nr:hypothetical protein EVAR_55840_1 [Eumeta japonica]
MNIIRNEYGNCDAHMSCIRNCPLAGVGPIKGRQSQWSLRYDRESVYRAQALLRSCAMTARARGWLGDGTSMTPASMDPKKGPLPPEPSGLYPRREDARA